MSVEQSHQDLEVAVIGMSGRFPDAADIYEFWQNIRSGIESVVRYDDDELRARGVSEDRLSDRDYVKTGVWLDDPDMFDADFFGFTPREAKLADPQHRLLLECAAEALAQAGYAQQRRGESIGVYAGGGKSVYLIKNLLPYLDPNNDDSIVELMEMLSGNSEASLASTVAYKLDLHGPAVSIQTACSTSLMAVHMACQALLGDECDMALAGGVSLNLMQGRGYLYRPGSIESSDGHCRAFDAAASGTILGSGAGVVVLKRLEDALEDGDTIHAVIKGSAANNDGADKVGYTAPSIGGQAAVIRAAQGVADVSADTIDYVEAHGTGTILGDPIEMAALTQAFRAGTDRRGYCAVGSVKTNIGHLDAAAGIAGLIKTILALRNRTLPPSLNFSRPNPKIDFESSPFYVNTECRPWPQTGHPRRAGVSSFGIGGTNVHVVLEEAPGREEGEAGQAEDDEEPDGEVVRLLMLSAKTATALRASAVRLAAFVEGNPDVSLGDAEFTLRVGRARFEHRAVVLASDAEEVVRAVERQESDRYFKGRVLSERPTVAFLFPGQGAQHPGMGQVLYEREAVFREVFDQCCERLEPWLGLDLRALILVRDEGPESRKEAEAKLGQTRYTQPALFVVSYAMAKWWQSQGIEPDAMLGHSIGEYVAACLAGVFDLEDALRIVAMRGELLQAMEPGAMLAVALPEEDLLARLPSECEIAAVNAPEQCVLAGGCSAIEKAGQTLDAAGVLVRRLRVSHAFHSALVEPMLAEFREHLSKVKLKKPTVPFISNVTGDWITAEQAAAPDYWARQVRSCVRFADGIEVLLGKADRVLLEVGAGETLRALAGNHAEAASRWILSSQLRPKAEAGQQALQPLRCLAQLWTAGVDIDGAACFGQGKGRRIPLPTYPFERRAYWIDPPQGLGRMHGQEAGGSARESLNAAVQGRSTPVRCPDGGAGEEHVDNGGHQLAQHMMHARPELDTPYEEPQGDIERALAEIWQDLLGIGGIGRHDDFFDLGGQSLLAAQLLARIRNDLGQEVALKEVFETPTVADIAQRLKSADTVLVAPIESADRSRPLRLSWSQQRLWFLEQLEDMGSAYHIEGALRLEGDLDEQALQGTLDTILTRHEVLRTVFVRQEEQGEPAQVVMPPCPFELQVKDLSRLEEEKRETALKQVLHEVSARVFDLGRGPLIRGVLIRLREQEHLLWLGMHHIVSDGWSMGVLTREMAALYTAYSQGGANPLPTLPVQYVDYAQWQRQWLRPERLGEQLSFWRQTLQGAPSLLELPTDRPRPAVQSHAGAKIAVELDEELTRGLHALSRRHGATLFMVLQAGWSLLLSRLSGQDDVVIGTPVANRRRSELEGLIGFFVNTLALRTRIDSQQTVSELLTRVKEHTLAAYEHQDAPFEQVVEAVQPERSLAHSPLFQVMLVLQNTPGEELKLPGLRLRTEDVERDVSQFDMSLSLAEVGSGLRGSLEYCTALFDRATMERWLGHFRVLLGTMVSDDTRPVAELPWLTPAERELVLEGFNATQAEYPKEALIHELFEAQVERTPEAVAVVYEDEQLTYAELNAKANQLAHRLRQEGVGPDVLVAISAERSQEMVVGLLGILKAGGAYVPVDPEYPQDRIAYMLADSAAPVLLTQGRLVERLPGTAARTLLLDEENTYEGQSQTNPGRQGTSLTSRSLAYVIYTSGSTGLPKGVMVEHRQVGNLLNALQWRYALDMEDRALQFVSVSFDAAAEEIFSTLTTGAGLVLRDREQPGDVEAFWQTCDRHGVTVLHLPVAFWQRLMLDDTGPLPESLRLLAVGGDRLDAKALKRWHERAEAVAVLLNEYGPTETTVTASMHAFTGDERTQDLIGCPLANVRMYILDERGEPVPLGVAGEIHIGGEGVARGYLNRPDLTAERFVKDPFVGREDVRMYRTGDLGRWTEDGTIEYLGRNDDQVKIRGFRVELGEIEARLAELPGVREVVVLAREDVPGDRRLVAYWTTPAGTAEAEVPTLKQLRDHLKAELPGYMVPAAFVKLEAMPLTPNGKVDREALPAPDASALSVREYEAPQGQTEEVLAGIWQELLGVERVGRHDSFFDLGGHSLLAVQLLARMRQVLGQEISLKDLFDAPTLAEVASRLQQADASLLAPIGHADRGRPLLLSWAQQRLWFLEQMEDLGTTYHMPAVLRLQGELDVQALQRTLDAIVARHEALRTVFVQADGDAEPVQVIRPVEGFALKRQDLSALEVHEREESVRQALRQAMQKRFDLSQGPLIRGLLLKLKPDEHVLLLEMHHIVSDGWSMGVLVRELSALYEAFSQGQADPLPALPIQYADYAQWQRQWLTGERLGEQLAFWQEYLQGGPELLELPTDHPRPAVQSHAGAMLGFELDAELVQGLKALASKHGATLFMVLQAGWSLLLGRLSGQDDVVIGTPVANRRRSELEGLIGFFVNTLALRTKIDPEQTVAGLLQTVRQQTLSAFGHQDVPFEQVVEVVQPTRSLAHSPLFQVMLVLQNMPEAELELPGLTLRQQEDLEWDTTHFDLTLSVSEAKDGSMAGVLQYCSDLFDQSTVQRWLGHLRVLLAAMAADDARPVAELPWLTTAEREQVLQGFNATQAEYPREALIHELFEAQVERSPDAVAVVYEDEQLTYAGLNARANQLAYRLRSLTDDDGQPLVRPDVLVAISAERSLEMVVGLLGILKAGGAYVPVDPEYPEDRIAYMLADSAAPMLLTQQRLVQRMPGTAARTLLLDAEETYADQPQTNLDRQTVGATSRNLAYVIYTSGSTGLPKGVMLEHRGVCNLAQVQGEAFAVDALSRVLQFASPSFDACVSEIVVTLSHGAQLHLGSSEALMPGEPLCELLKSRRITHATLPPAALGVMESVPELESLRTLVVAGEACPIGTARAWSKGRRFVNAYGPTEATVCATMLVVDGGLDEAQPSLPIGRPIANARVYILDGHGQPVPLGVAGEIHISGDGVARGYLNRPELTAERFVKDPFAGGDGSRMYRTGDLGRWKEDGTIEYLGRNDDQVKVRGFRVELGEIEARLAELPEVREAVVLAREDVPGDRRLVAYWTAQEARSGTVGDETKSDTEESVAVTAVERLRAYLKAELPGYMVPGAFVRLEAMPLTPNGKVDRKALPAPDANALRTKEYEAPQGQTEEVLAGIWQELLGVEKVGRHDSFFDLGGHSLLITQVVSQVNEKLGVDVPVRMLFEHSTLKDLADAMDSRNAKGGQDDPADHVALVNLDDEVVLDPAIRAIEALAPAVSLDDARSVLLTGATGFLGAYLLRDLLQRSSAQVHCLVRADDDARAMERIVQALVKYDLWDESMRERIAPVCGDLAKPLLGLGPARFESLADDVDLIVHNGAWVNFLYPYEVLKAANVIGTQEVLRLATRTRLKPVHYVSTISVFPGQERIQKITESTELGSWKGLQGGYSQSKWVAEGLMFLAAERGIPVFIHRPGSISGDTLHGACPTHDLIFRLVKTCVELGMAPDMNDSMNMAPVDYVSAAIVQLARQLPDGGAASLPPVSHLVNPRAVSSKRFYEMVSDLGYPVKLVSADQWYSAMLAAARGSEEHALHRFLPMLSGEDGQGPADEGAVPEIHQPEFECAQTQAMLDGSGVVCPELDEALLALYFEYFERTGFLHHRGA